MQFNSCYELPSKSDAKTSPSYIGGLEVSRGKNTHSNGAFVPVFYFATALSYQYYVKNNLAHIMR